MNQNSVKTIGIKDEPRKDSYLVNVNQADGLKGILNRDFDEWSNFDSWESCLLYTSPSPRDNTTSRMPSSA